MFLKDKKLLYSVGGSTSFRTEGDTQDPHKDGLLTLWFTQPSPGAGSWHWHHLNGLDAAAPGYDLVPSAAFEG